mgnify:CR=1 FL=1
MDKTRHIIEIQTRPVVGYGGDSAAAGRLDATFDAALGPDRIAALKIPFEHDRGAPGIDATLALHLTASGGLGARKLAGLPTQDRERLGGLFFLYASSSGMRVGPRRVPPGNPVYFLMSHGLLVLNGGLLQTGIEPAFVAEHLAESSLAMLGRAGSNHDRIIFASQAARLVQAILASNGYRDMEVRLTASQPAD